METIVDALNSSAAQALGWTLVHSLWQGLLCYLLGVVLLRAIPSRQSAARYAAAVGVLALMVICSVVTFAAVYAASGTARVATSVLALASYSPSVAYQTGTETVLSQLTLMVSNNIGFLAALWLAGAMLFMLRMLAGYWYMGFIRQSAEPAGVLWQELVSALAVKLNVRTRVEVAQSAVLSAPIVMGYFRPVILVPVGMFSGLTTDQLEAIFIHELMHIKRGDYLINLVQGIVEAIFFFNPFAWMMSAAIRREREHCCDDGVVINQGNALAYVRALATLEESKLMRAGFAPSLADNKNQLLNRIKRMMEKSVHRYSSRDRIVPAVLLVVGLMCASWLTIQSRDREIQSKDQNRPSADEVSGNEVRTFDMADTIIAPKSDSYYRYTIKTIDAQGKENVHVVEGYGDEGDIREVIAGVEPPLPMDAPEPFEPMEPFIMQPDPARGPAMIAPMGPASVLPRLAPTPSPMYFRIDGDTIPRGRRDWDAFGHEFEETFKKRFEEFYRQHEKEMKEMMKELEDRFGHNEGMGARFEEHARIAAALAREQEWARNAEELSARGEAMRFNNFEKHQAMELAQIQSQLDVLHERDLRRIEDEMGRLSQSIKVFEKKLHDAQEQVRKAAIKDGYLKSDEQIHNIDMNDSGMTINGKKVKPADAKRYREIMHAVED